MALGRKSEAIVDNSNTHDITLNDKDDVSPQTQAGVFGSDPEKAEGEPKYRKMSRIGGPIPGIVGESDTDSTLSVGKQLELEQSNSIKYRTCSWQKVPYTLLQTYLIFPVCAMHPRQMVRLCAASNFWSHLLYLESSSFFAGLGHSDMAFRPPRCSSQSIFVSP